MKRTHFDTNAKKWLKALLVVCLLTCNAAFSQSLKVAVAANLQPVMLALKKGFKQKAGIEIQPIVGASGNLAAQIRNGAPYDLFLSADMAFPEALFKQGFATGKPAVYALGNLIICSSQNIGFENWERLLLSYRVKKIAIGNPAIAPYGKAAQEALRLRGIINEVRSKIVYGESISQVNTYVSTGVVEVGFTAEAFVKDPANKQHIYWHAVNPKIYKPIQQGIIILKPAAGKPNAVKFYNYMLSPAAKAIMQKFGYH